MIFAGAPIGVNWDTGPVEAVLPYVYAILGAILMISLAAAAVWVVVDAMRGQK